MRKSDLVGFAFGAIFAHPMRSMLTSLGVVIGVAAVVMMTSIGLGAQKQVDAMISGMGSNLLQMQAGAARGGGGGGGGPVNLGAGNSSQALTEEDATAIATTVSNVGAVAALVRGNSQLVSENGNMPSQVEGVTASYFDARDLKITSGRAFTDDEVKGGAKVVVIGPTVADTLFPGEDPIGQKFRIGSIPVEVIGVLKARGQGTFGQDQDSVVEGPLPMIRSRVVGRRFKGTDVQNIFIKSSDAKSLNQVQEETAELMRQRRKVRETDDFTIQNLASIMEAAQQSSQTFTILLAAVAGVSLVVGGIGIMNIMLVSVTERTREIGLRMALGAKRNDVLVQFALEALTLSVFGGLIGLALGLGGALAMPLISSSWPVAIAPWAAPLAVGFSLFVGGVFGSYPAWRAAQLDPIEALRRD